MKKILLISLILLSSLVCACGQKVLATTTTPISTETTESIVVNNGTNSFSVDTRLDFGKTISAGSVYSKEVTVNINNTGKNQITKISLVANGLESGWSCVGSTSGVLLNSGEAVPYTITLTSNQPIVSGMNLNFTVTLTASAFVDVQHILTCYGEIVVSK